MILSKNPVGFNESMRSVLAISPKPTVILALNDRHLDGTDVSWIWDTDVEELVATAVHIVCTGDRAWDMGLRAKYALKLKTCLAGRQAQYSILKTISVEPDLKHAIQTGLEKTKKGETLYILPTYSAMLDLRKILTGRKI
jgi:lipid II isoglutaminyl synthase (glutamine-hydrolysing)